MERRAVRAHLGEELLMSGDDQQRLSTRRECEGRAVESRSPVARASALHCTASRGVSPSDRSARDQE